MYRVCIADDEIYVRQSIIRRMEIMNLPLMIVGTAGEADGAWELYESEKPDIFFVDIRMPGKTGLDFIESVRQKNPKTRTKFIIVSGYDDFAYMQKAIKMGVSDYIKKPFQQEEFEETVFAVCHQIDEERQNKVQRNYWESFYNQHKQEPVSGTFLLLYKKGLRRYSQIHEIEQICTLEYWEYLWFHGIENVLILYHKKSGQKKYGEELSRKMKCFVIYQEDESVCLQDMISRMDVELCERFKTKIPYVRENSCRQMHQKATQKEFGLAIENTKENHYSSCIEAALKESANISTVFQALVTELADCYIRNGKALPNDLRQEFFPMALAKYDEIGEVEQVLNHYAKKLNQELTQMEEKREVIERIVQYMDSHYAEEISLTSLAGEFFLAPTYLAKKFKEKTGKTVIQYLEEIRMEQAKEMLRTSGYSISEIALQTGYNDSNYFTRSFKRVLGMTPREYRNTEHDNANKVTE